MGVINQSESGPSNPRVWGYIINLIADDGDDDDDGGAGGTVEVYEGDEEGTGEVGMAEVF